MYKVSQTSFVMPCNIQQLRKLNIFLLSSTYCKIKLLTCLEDFQKLHRRQFLIFSGLMVEHYDFGHQNVFKIRKLGNNSNFVLSQIFFLKI